MAFSNTLATTYDDKVVRQFAVMTVVWGVVGMLVGVIIAAQLTWPELNFGISWLSYGRLRPVVCLPLPTMWCSEPVRSVCLPVVWPPSRFGVGNW